MLPVSPTRAAQLVAPSSWSSVGAVAIELLLGVAAVSDERRRQQTALAAVRSIFMHTREGEMALQNYVAQLYERREEQGQQ
jgi:hypothetical protein